MRQVGVVLAWERTVGMHLSTQLVIQKKRRIARLRLRALLREKEEK